ncbi:SufD family Fe-S cluster assembly protein [Candidatus Karelsulcia muelleri]
MTLKDKLILLFQNKPTTTNQYIESIINKSRGCFKNIGLTALKQTCFNSVLNYDFDIPKRNNECEDYSIQDISFNNNFISLYFLNGLFSYKLSNLCQLQTHIQGSSLNHLLSTPPNPNMKYFCKTICYKDHLVFKNTFIALNISLTPDGFFLKIPQNTHLNIPIEIINIYSTPISSLINLKNIIVVGKQSKVKIIERHISTSKKYIVSNLFTEIYAKDHSQIELFKLETDLLKTYLIDNTVIHQSDKSVCQVFTFSAHIRHIINNIHCFKLGQDTKSLFNGLYLGPPSNNISTLYNHVVIKHEKSNAVSYQTYKGILSKNAYGIFKSNIQIKANLDNINSNQTNSHLLLSNYAKVLSRQEFQTASSQVKCSHGTNMGQLDTRTIFFFRTRGIGKHKSIQLAILMFANELIQLVNLNILKNKLIAYLKYNLLKSKIKFDLIKS